MPPLGIAPRLSAPQAEVLLLYYSGRARGGAGHRSRISTLRRLYATIYNTPPCVRASAGTRTRILCLEGTNTTLVLRTHSFMHVTIWADTRKILRTKINFHDSIASSRPNGATAARWIPDPKAGGSNPSSVTHPGVAQLVEQWTVKRVAQRSIGRQFKSASPE